MPPETLDSFAVLEVLVKNNLVVNERISEELNLLKEAPAFMCEAFLQAYQRIHIDGHAATPVNDCHSLIAYELGITTTPPNDISFHYSVAPGALPDIDSDFAHPDDIKAYIREKYGEERVVGIGTYGKYKFRSLLNDLCRVVLKDDGTPEMPREDAMAFNKKLPFKIDQSVSEDMADDEVIDADAELFSNSLVQDLQHKHPRIFQHFKSLYAIPRYRGKHAAGLVILPAEAKNTLPLSINKGTIVSEYVEGQGVSELGSIGAIKFDILGLKTLKVLDTCNKLIMFRYQLDENSPSPCACKQQSIPCPTDNKIPMLIRESTGEQLIDLNALCLNVTSVYKAISEGNTQGIFQLEPDGITAFTKKYGPKEFNDLKLITSLFRPGPLDARLDEKGMPIDPDDINWKRAPSAAMAFIERYHNRAKVYYTSEKLKDILEETFGICVFQETISRMIMAMTNCSFADAEKTRKFLTKVNPTSLKFDQDLIGELNKYEDRFTEEAIASGCSDKEIKDTWNLIVPFARYGFNLAHAVSYSLVSYQTAFCRTLFPLEYLTSLMTHNIGKTDKLVEYIRTAQSLGIKILPPNINTSNVNFAIGESDAIICGLEAVKGVGDKAATSIIENRKEFGPFTSLDDFLSRKIYWRNVDIGVLQILIKIGAFDDISPNRALTTAKVMIAKKKAKRADFETIDIFSEDEPTRQKEIYVEEWSESQKTDYEREALGFILEDYIFKNKDKIKRIHEILTATAASAKKQATIGTIEEIKIQYQKDGEKYARISVTNVDGKKENWLLFASVWSVFKNNIKAHKTYFCIGEKDNKDEKNIFKVSTIDLIDSLINPEKES